jgi:hypothetical protein
MPVTTYEAGLVAGDDRLHVLQKRIDGATAVCGAGRIVQTVPGRFDSDDPKACPGCVRSIGVPPA